MLPSTARSSAGQFCHDGSWAWTRSQGALQPRFERDEHLATPAFDPAAAAGARLGRFPGAWMPPGGRRSTSSSMSRIDSASSSKRTVNRAATSPRLPACLAHRQGLVRRNGQVDPQVERLAARPCCRPGQAQARGELGQDLPGHDEAVLCAGVLVVNAAKHFHLRLDVSDHFDQTLCMLPRSVATPPGKIKSIMR